jgi:2-oxoglutarate dehydrogenase E2 component (dihydrolipoamide succinyltransferase)
MAAELRLEPVSAENEYATILRWHKREGDAVTAGETILEVEAEKANLEVTAPVSGVLVSILAVEGDEVRVGETVAVIDDAAAG